MKKSLRRFWRILTVGCWQAVSYTHLLRLCKFICKTFTRFHAARVAGYEFLSRGGNVTFAVRSMEKGERLANELAETQSDGRTRIHSCLLTDIIGAHDILINCTPVGMYPNTEAMPVSEKVISRCAAVFDAVYNPRKTQLLACAEPVSYTHLDVYKRQDCDSAASFGFFCAAVVTCVFTP